MGNRVGYILSFLAGGLVGAIVAYKFAYDKAEEKSDIEIEEMRQYFLSKDKNAVTVKKATDAAEKSRQAQNKPSVVELVNVKDKPDTQKVNYTTYSEDVPEDVNITAEPTLVSEDEFGENPSYSRVNLTYYDDLILADDSTMRTFKKTEIDQAVGREALDRLNDVDEVFVRNDRTRTYYNIVNSDLEYAVAAGMESDDEEY